MDDTEFDFAAVTRKITGGGQFPATDDTLTVNGSATSGGTLTGITSL